MSTIGLAERGSFHVLAWFLNEAKKLRDAWAAKDSPPCGHSRLVLLSWRRWSGAESRPGTTGPQYLCETVNARHPRSRMPGVYAVQSAALREGLLNPNPRVQRLLKIADSWPTDRGLTQTGESVGARGGRRRV